MSLYTPIGFYQQKLAAAAPAGFSVRSDPYGAYIKVAVPGNVFSTLGMTNVYDSIDSLVRGSGTNFAMTPSIGSGGSVTTNAATNTNTYTFSSYGYTTSLATSGRAAALSTATSNLSFGSSNFVIEGYFYFTGNLNAPPYNNFIFGEISGDYLLIDHNSDNQRFYLLGASNNPADSYTTGAWQYWAFVRSGTSFYVYKNGTRIGSSTVSGTISYSGTWNGIGYNNANDNAAKYTQDFRIYIGTNKGYTGSTITPPNSIVTN
jgi:hypothetical protein